MADKVRRLAILLACGPRQAGFEHATRIAAAALDRQIEVYVYFLDDGVEGLEDERALGLRGRGARFFACAHAAILRRIERRDQAIFSGLTVLDDLIVSADRFLCFGSG